MLFHIKFDPLTCLIFQKQPFFLKINVLRLLNAKRAYAVTRSTVQKHPFSHTFFVHTCSPIYQSVSLPSWDAFLYQIKIKITM